MSSMPPSSRATSPCGWPATARRSLALDGKDLRARSGHDGDRRRRRPRTASAASWAASATGCDRGDHRRLPRGARCSIRVRTAATGRKLGIESDARYRFERGVDPAVGRLGRGGRDPPDPGAVRRRGEPGVVAAGELPDWRRALTLRPERVAGLGGVDVPAAEAARILAGSASQSTAERGAALRSRCRPGAPDVEGEADLVEEVLRVQGYRPHRRRSRCPGTAPLPEPAIDAGASAAPASPSALLAARGLLEAVTFSFMPPGLGRAASAAAQPALPLANPISADLDADAAVAPAQSAGGGGAQCARAAMANCALFEVGPRYARRYAPEGQLLMAARLARRRDRPAPLGGDGRGRSMPSTPRPTRWPCWRRSARRSRICRSRPTRRPGIHPGPRRARCGSAATVLAQVRRAASTRPARARPRRAGRRLRDRSSIACPQPRAKARRRAGRCSRPRPSSRSSATSPSGRRGGRRRRSCCAPPGAPTRR